MQYGRISSRVAAALVDAVLTSPLSAVPLLSYFLYAGAEVALATFAQAFRVAYDVVLHALYGQTVGKRVLSLRVVTTEGDSISWGRAFLRSAPVIVFGLMEATFALVHMLLSFIAPEAEGVVLDDLVALELITQWGRLGYFVCDGVVLVLSPQRRSLSDYLAGTAVIVVAPATVRALEERPDVPRRFADPELLDSAGEPEDDQPYDEGPLLVLADGRLFSCPDCARKVNFGASECQGCGERFRYQNGHVFLDD